MDGTVGMEKNSEEITVDTERKVYGIGVLKVLNLSMCVFMVNIQT